MTTKKVACFVISHNRGKSTLSRAVGSLRKAIDYYKAHSVDYEFTLEVVDDSTEDTWDVVSVCTEFKADLCRMEPCQQVFAWEKALELAHRHEADYVKILLDDDWVEEKYFTKLLYMRGNDNIGMAVCAANVQNMNLTLYKIQEQPCVMPSRDFGNIALSGAGNGGMPESPSCVLFRNHPKLKIRYEEFDGTVLEPYSRPIYFNDLLLLIDAAKSGDYVLFLPQELVNFGTDAGSLTLTKTEEVMKGRETFRNYVRKHPNVV